MSTTKKAANDQHFGADQPDLGFSNLHKIVLLFFAATFGVMIWGVTVGGWWMAQMPMPILAPVADFNGVPRSLVVTAFATASGWVNLITPTSAVVMGDWPLAACPINAG